MYTIINFLGLVTKGYHGCKCCGPSLKARWSNNLRKPMYDCSRVFLPEEHLYRRAISAFNGKLERLTQRPEVMTPAEWLRAYERASYIVFYSSCDRGHGKLIITNVWTILDG